MVLVRDRDQRRALLQCREPLDPMHLVNAELGRTDCCTVPSSGDTATSLASLAAALRT